jgi:hypothetical protein
MVVADDVDGDDGGEDLETPLPDVQTMTNLTPETKIVDAEVLCFAKGPCFWIPSFFRYIWG